MTVKSLLINEADRPAQRAGSPSLESAISPENPIYQGDLAGTADTAGDVSTRNDSATARADTGNIRGICSPGVPAAEAAEDRLDKIEAMVTDLFRQLRNDRAVRQVLYDRINEIDALPLRNMLLRIETGEEFGRGIHQRMKALEGRLDAVDTWRNQTSARVDEMAEQKATITDAQQIHNRINRMGERIESILNATQHQQETIKSVISAAKDQQAVIANHGQRLMNLQDRITAMERQVADNRQQCDHRFNGLLEHVAADRAKRTIKGGWVNVYRDRAGVVRWDEMGSRTKEDALMCTPTGHRIACIQIPDFTEGEGL